MPFTDPNAVICPIATICHEEEQSYITQLAAFVNEQKEKYNEAVTLLNEAKKRYNDIVDLINELRTKAGITDQPEAQKIISNDSQSVLHDDVVI